MIDKILKGINTVRALSRRRKIIFISEYANWVIKEIGKDLVSGINKTHKNIASIAYTSELLKNKILHFGSINPIQKDGKMRYIHPSNKIILTWNHVVNDDKRLSIISDLNKKIDILHVLCSITRDILIENGLDKAKVVMIPQSIDLDIFYKYSAEEKATIKDKLGLPKNKIIIGSFQKDGNGWGEGMIPKYVKGPDVFCDVVEKLNKKHNIHVLLTGPSRGYVKNRLDKAGISFTHSYFEELSEIVDYYNALDLYIIASRVEGGPKSILESMACGVPVVSTRVGMAVDVITNEENGLLADIEDVDQLTAHSDRLIRDTQLMQKLIINGLKRCQEFDSDTIHQQYLEKIYLPLLNQLHGDAIQD